MKTLTIAAPTAIFERNSNRYVGLPIKYANHGTPVLREAFFDYVASQKGDGKFVQDRNGLMTFDLLCLNHENANPKLPPGDWIIRYTLSLDREISIEAIWIAAKIQ